jgi:hypothetical protein
VVFSITEQWDDGDWISFNNWSFDLEKGEVFTAEPVIFDKVAYFTTETSGAGLCDVGLGRIWGVHYTGYEPSKTDDIEPMFDLDGDATTQDDLALYIELTDTEIYGLQLVQRASCLDAASNYTPWSGDYQDSATSVPTGGASSLPGSTGGPTFSGASSAPMELVVQTGTVGQSDAKMSAPSGAGMSRTGNKISRKVASPSQSLFSLSWGLLFD